MKTWIDLANSPHVPFFRPLIEDFRARGDEVCVTARLFAQTVELAEKAGLQATTIGAHGGGKLRGKGVELVSRAWELARWGWSKKFDLAVSHNSYAQILAARILGVPVVTLMDYEHQPANHLAFRLATRIIVPEAFPANALRRFGVRNERRVRRYPGIKEDVYLADFTPDPSFDNQLLRFGIKPDDVLIVVRPPAREALYHRFDNELFDELLARLDRTSGVKVMLLARTGAQEAELKAKWENQNFIFPDVALDGANLIARADMVISAGGTMNREAAALGTPAATVYAGQWAAIDDALVRAVRLQRIRTSADVEELRIAKKPLGASAVHAANQTPRTREIVRDLILEVGG